MGVRKAPETQNVTGYQKFRSRHPLVADFHSLTRGSMGLKHLLKFKQIDINRCVVVTAAWLLSVKLSNFGVRSDRPETRETLSSLKDQQTCPPHVLVMYLHLFHHLINLIPSFPLLITSAFDKHPSIVHIANPI